MIGKIAKTIGIFLIIMIVATLMGTFIVWLSETSMLGLIMICAVLMFIMIIEIWQNVS